MASSLSLPTLADLLGQLFEQVRDGVVLCDGEGGVLAANRAAAGMLGAAGPGPATIDQLLAGPWPSRALAYLQRSPDNAIDFLCEARDGKNLLSCRLGRYTGPDPDAPLLLLTLREALPGGGLSRPEAGRCDSIEKLRQPLSNLKAAAENLVTHPEMSQVMRSAFENVIAQESVSLATTFDDLAGLCSERLAGRCELAACDGAALVGRVLALGGISSELADPDGPVKLVADHVWLQRLLLSLFDFLAEQGKSITDIRFHPEAAGNSMNLDIIWKGAPLKASVIEEWRGTPLSEAPGSPTGADILRSHGSDLWSQEGGQPGLALVRLPLPLVPPGGVNA